MKKKKGYIPYIITMYGTLKTETEDTEKQMQELYETNINYLISNANEKFVEVDEE